MKGLEDNTALAPFILTQYFGLIVKQNILLYTRVSIFSDPFRCLFREAKSITVGWGFSCKKDPVLDFSKRVSHLKNPKNCVYIKYLISPQVYEISRHKRETVERAWFIIHEDGMNGDEGHRQSEHQEAFRSYVLKLFQKVAEQIWKFV